MGMMKSGVQDNEMLEEEPSILMTIIEFFSSTTFRLADSLKNRKSRHKKLQVMLSYFGRICFTIALLSQLFCRKIEGKKRREKPSRWKNTVKESVTVEDKHEKLAGWIQFGYKLEHDSSCNCVRRVPTNITTNNVMKAHEFEFEKFRWLWDEMSPFQMPHLPDRYLERADDILMELDKSPAKRTHYLQGVKALDEYLIRFEPQDKSGVILMIGMKDRPICNDHFNDLTATALCQAYGFKGGRRSSLTVADREDSIAIIKGQWPQSFDPNVFRCFRKFQPKYDLDKESSEQILNVTVMDKCKDFEIEDTLPCSHNQASAITCYSDLAPTLQFYDFELSRSVDKFYLTFNVRYVKLGRLYPLYEENVKLLGLLPRRSDFSGTMCGRKISVDFQSTREMGKGRHHVILGKFLKKCKECVQLMFKGTLMLGEAIGICKPTSREKWLDQRDRREGKERKQKRRLPHMP